MSTQLTGSQRPTVLALAHIDLRAPADGEHLEPPSLGQSARVLGQVAVEAGPEPGARIFGLVDHAGALVHRHRLVGEATGVADRPSLLQLARTARQRHLEEVAVALREAHGGASVRAADRLLGGDPAARPRPRPPAS